MYLITKYYQNDKDLVVFTVINNMIYANKPKVRQDSLHESHKVNILNLD